MNIICFVKKKSSIKLAGIGGRRKRRKTIFVILPSNICQGLKLKKNCNEDINYQYPCSTYVLLKQVIKIHIPCNKKFDMKVVLYITYIPPK